MFLDKYDNEVLVRIAHPNSVLNWGTQWTKRRYASIAGLCNLFKDAGEDVEVKSQAFSLWQRGNDFDRIDVACHVANGFLSEIFDEHLEFDSSQLGDDLEFQYRQDIWKHLMSDAISLTFPNSRESYEQQAVATIIESPISNLEYDYGYVSFWLSTSELNASFRVVTSSARERTIFFDLDTKAAHWEFLIPELEDAGWTLLEGTAKHSSRLFISLSGLDPMEHVLRTLVKTVTNLLNGTNLETQSVRLGLQMNEVSPQDKEFISARTNFVQKYFDPTKFQIRFDFS